MNKYQREKAKRLKRLENLGVNYYARKRILRKYNLEKVDIIIDEVIKFKTFNASAEIENLLLKIVKKFIKNIKNRLEY